MAPRCPLRVRGSDADEGETRQSLLGSDGMDDDCASSDLKPRPALRIGASGAF